MSAYLGYLKGYTRIPDVEVDAEIKYLITRAILESARALSKKHGASLDDNLEFFEGLIIRFENKLLDDTMLRVGKDTKRKLSAADRLGGAFKIVREEGMVPAHIAIGIAAGFLFDHPEDPVALETSSYAKENGIAAALEKYCDITDAADVTVISKFYDMLVNKASFTELCEELATLKFKEH
jgi:mannitol-1-phosphate 5-dehydrogenase